MKHFSIFFLSVMLFSTSLFGVKTVKEELTECDKKSIRIVGTHKFFKNNVKGYLCEVNGFSTYNLEKDTNKGKEKYQQTKKLFEQGDKIDQTGLLEFYKTEFGKEKLTKSEIKKFINIAREWNDKGRSRELFCNEFRSRLTQRQLVNIYDAAVIDKPNAGIKFLANEIKKNDTHYVNKSMQKINDIINN